MKIAFDTNVLIDAIAQRGEYREAQALIIAVAEEKAAGMVSANSITDIYYVLRKRIGDAKAREAVWNLMAVLEVADVNGEICAMALGSPMKDYEDAVLAFCARQAGADTIVTGDAEFLRESGSPVPVSTVRAMLEAI